MTDEELKAIEERAEKATEALNAWANDVFKTERRVDVATVMVAHLEPLILALHETRTDVPALVAEVRKWRTVADGANDYASAVEADYKALDAEVRRLRRIEEAAKEARNPRHVHAYMGLCPDDTEGWDSRDTECPACQDLMRLDAALESDDDQE